MRAIQSILATLTMFLAVLLPIHGAERHPADMDAAWKSDWNTCDQQGVQPAPLLRIKACSSIISRGEAGNPNKVVYAFAFSDRASAYYDAGLYAQASADFDKSINYRLATHAGETLLSFTYLARARCLLKMAQFEKAIEDVDGSFETSLMKSAFEDKNDWQRELRGDIAVARGDYPAAEKYYKKEFQQHPDRQELDNKLAAARELASKAIQVGSLFRSGNDLSESAPSVAASELPPHEVVDRKNLPLESSVENTAAPIVSAESSRRHLKASEIALLVKRGEELVATGNIGAARLMFQLAAEAGDPVAAFAVAETYDQSVLEKLGAKGITPDIALAQRWYQKAKVLGSTAAR